jgi:hypothetical protein
VRPAFPATALQRSRMTKEVFDRWVASAAVAFEDPEELVAALAEHVREQVEREWLQELEPVFVAVARSDQPLLEYHGRRLGVALLPLHGKGYR